MAPASITDFDEWLVETCARVGSFPMLIVLVEICETTVSAPASSYLHVIGDDPAHGDACFSTLRSCHSLAPA